MNNKKAFTLLEILIALAILMIGVASVVNMFPIGLHAAKRAADFSSAGILAQAKMAEVMYLGYNNWSSVDGDLTTIPDNTVGSTSPPASAPADGKNPFPDDDGYKWYIRISSVIANQLARAEVVIYWNDRGEETNETFITYIAKYD